MSIQSAIEQLGFSKDEIDTLLKLRKIASRGNSAEVKRTTNGGYTVYEVKKEKR